MRQRSECKIYKEPHVCTELLLYFPPTQFLEVLGRNPNLCFLTYFENFSLFFFLPFFFVCRPSFGLSVKEKSRDYINYLIAVLSVFIIFIFIYTLWSVCSKQQQSLYAETKAYNLPLVLFFTFPVRSSAALTHVLLK